MSWETLGGSSILASVRLRAARLRVVDEPSARSSREAQEPGATESGGATCQAVTQRVALGQMDVFGLEARQSELARGIVIVRSARGLTSAEQREVWKILAAGGITEDDSDEQDDSDEPPLRLLSAPWLPPLADELATQRAALEEVHRTHPLEAVWFVKVETGVDGEAWQELRAAHLGERHEQASRATEPRRIVDAIFDEAEVLYTAPDAPPTELTNWPGERAAALRDEAEDPLASAVLARATGEHPAALAMDEGAAPEEESSAEPQGNTSAEPDDPSADLDAAIEDDADEDDEEDEDDEPPSADEPSLEEQEEDTDDEVVQLFLSESHWRNGPPPTERSVPFPLEHHPEVLDQYDWREFGIAVKLGGSAIPGEDSVINAFFALWLSAYQDERFESFEPFARADVAHDRVHRSALLWVERFTVPATPSDQVSFLLWIIHRLHEVVPVAWARFDIHDEASKIRRDRNGEIELILAGNPLAERATRYGEREALAWAVSQSGWSRAEVAAMLVELALEHDPEAAESAASAERLLRRALSFDPASEASIYLVTVLVRQGRAPEAAALAREGTPELRLFFVREAAEHAESKLGLALELLDPETMEPNDDEDLAALAHIVADSAPRYLGEFLARIPARRSMVPHLYNASFELRREQSLAILLRVIELPEPDDSIDEARSAMVMAWNNACIHAHALGEYELAASLADRGMRFAEENPHIYHSAACAYAATGALDRALVAVREAIRHDYQHIEKMETDPDLAPLHPLPEFSALFAEWRHQRADLN